MVVHSRSNSRASGLTSWLSEMTKVGHMQRQQIAQGQFVCRVGIGVQQADGDGLDLKRRQFSPPKAPIPAAASNGSSSCPLTSMRPPMVSEWVRGTIRSGLTRSIAYWL